MAHQTLRVQWFEHPWKRHVHRAPLGNGLRRHGAVAREKRIHVFKTRHAAELAQGAKIALNRNDRVLHAHCLQDSFLDRRDLAA